MGRYSAVCFLVAALVAVVSGCDSVSGPEQTPVRSPGTHIAAASTTAAQSSSAPVTSVPTTTAAPAASTLPTCTRATTIPMPECRLQSHDSAGFAFEVQRSGSGESGTFTIDVIDSNGAAIQTITEDEVELTAEQPRLRDTDGDGRDELLVPLVIGPYGTRFAVYHASGTGAATEFTRTSEITGLTS